MAPLHIVLLSIFGALLVVVLLLQVWIHLEERRLKVCPACRCRKLRLVSTSMIMFEDDQGKEYEADSRTFVCLGCHRTLVEDPHKHQLQPVPEGMDPDTFPL